MKAVSNSSILIGLSAINQLELLAHRFSEGVLVPQAVWNEVVETGKGRPGAVEVATASWITVCEVQDKDLVALLRTDLDAGEAEAIALFREQVVDMLLLDEKEARQAARRLGVSILGTVGVLIWAKRAGLILNLSAQLRDLQNEGGFRLSQAVVEKALLAVGEMT